MGCFLLVMLFYKELSKVNKKLVRENGFTHDK